MLGQNVQISIMTTKSQINWDLIDSVAEKLNVDYWARRKWRQRGHVPYKWRLPLINASRGSISLRDFDALDRRRNARG